jgi:membrane protein
MLWRAGQAKEGRFAACLRTVVFTLRKFDADRGFLRASALTFTTLLSLVPLLALTFSVLKGLGVQRRLEPLILERLAAGNQEIVTQALGYVDRTRVASLGVVGLAGLIFTSISVLGNIELSFNDIWQIRQGRTLLRKITDYVALLVVAPVLLFASLSLTTTLHSQSFLETTALLGPALRLLLRSTPFFATALAFTAAYLILPNRRIPLASALVGAASAGVLWHLAEWGYIRFQFGMVEHNAIYGTMAQLPALLVWVYTSWCIVLFGAELACVHEMPAFRSTPGQDEDLWVPMPTVALRALVLVAAPFEKGCPGPTPQELFAQLGLTPGKGTRLLEWLSEAQLVTLSRDEPPQLSPARAPAGVPVADLVERLAGLSSGGEGEELDLDLEMRVRRGLSGEFGDTTWADLARERES